MKPGERAAWGWGVQPLVAGAALSLLAGVVAVMLWGWPAATPALVMGFVATAIQVVAHRLLRRPTNPRSPFPAGWLWGMALRAAGIGVMVVLVLVDRERFAPLPAALAYVGVVVPLLLLELKTT